MPALAAISGGLATATATAIELGALEVHSKLGHPLRASIAYVLGPNETVNSSCVSLRSGNSGLPNLFGARVSVANGAISLSGNKPLNEPLLIANLVVDCPYTARISRNYTVFLDPPVEASAANSATPKLAAAAATPRPVTRARTARPPSPPITPNSSYRVRPGDSLSRIAERLQDRVIALQPAMTAIFDANPEAFTDNDPNQLEAGSLLTIPSFTGVTRRPASAPVEPAVPGGTLESARAQETAGVYNGADFRSPDDFAADTTDSPQAVEDHVEPTFDAPAAAATDTPAENRFSAAEVAGETDAAALRADADFADLRPGDVVVNEDLVAASTDEAAAIPDTTIAPPPRQIAGSRIVATPPSEEGLLSNWLVWLAVGLLTVFGAFVAFGQKLRERFGSTPIGAADTPARPLSTHGTPRVAAITVPESTMSVEEIRPSYDAVDFDLSDDSPTEENLALDADLIDGTGFEESDDVDVNQDFGFAATTALDMELPDLPGDPADAPETDIIPPPDRTRDDLVIDSEVLPDDEDYDMSVIVDATKMPNPNDVTERDLMAVPVDEDNGQTPIGNAYTINDAIDVDNEVDFDPMGTEIDDELAATQALSEEIEKAAADIASRAESGGETSIEMQLTSLSDLDLTSELEAQNDDYDDDVTARFEADDETVEMPAKDKNAG